MPSTAVSDLHVLINLILYKVTEISDTISSILQI